MIHSSPDVKRVANSNSRFEYDPARQKVIVLPLPTPFHDIAPTIMSDQVKMRMMAAGLDTFRRIMKLKVNRESTSWSPLLDILAR